MNTCHLCHQTVDVFSLASGVGTHVNGVHILTVKQSFDNLKLLLHSGDHFIFKFARQKRQGI